MEIPEDDLVDESFCDEFQQVSPNSIFKINSYLQLSQIVEEIHGFSYTNNTVPLQGEQPYSNITCIEFDHKENLLWVANDQVNPKIDLAYFKSFRDMLLLFIVPI